MAGQKTPLYEQHLAAGAKIVDFAGWQMPIQYSYGIIQEHLVCRKSAGLFDVSHMGRFRIRGQAASAFLDYALTNHAGGLTVGQSHYTILALPDGGAVDDAWLYRFDPAEFILVVNASNKDKDWAHLQDLKKAFADVQIQDLSESLAMIAIQGPQSEAIVKQILTSGSLPVPQRNAAGMAALCGCDVWIGRTGYTGEPTCFEIMMPAKEAGRIWEELLRFGASPVGLGARDTLRLEASLPLYGHEMGLDGDGKPFPILASPATKFALPQMDSKKDFVGRQAIEKQLAALERYKQGDFSDSSALSKRIYPVRLLDKGIARQGAVVFYQGKNVGTITSGTVAPYRKSQPPQDGQFDQRAVGLAYLDCRLAAGAAVEIDVRGRLLKAKLVKRNLKSVNSLAVAVFE